MTALNSPRQFATTDNASVVVFDFETTGMSPQQGDRVIEIGAVRLEDGVIADQFQSLINPGCPLNPFITDLTGISDAMLATAPDAEAVISDFQRFVACTPLVAHNASFDRRFLIAEFCRFGHKVPLAIGCSMLAARRIFPDAPNHKLGTLVSYLELPTARRFHRALADASMTAALWLRMEQELCSRYGFEKVPFALLKRLGQIPRAKADRFLQQIAGRPQDRN